MTHNQKIRFFSLLGRRSESLRNKIFSGSMKWNLLGIVCSFLCVCVCGSLVQFSMCVRRTCGFFFLTLKAFLKEMRATPAQAYLQPTSTALIPQSTWETGTLDCFGKWMGRSVSRSFFFTFEVGTGRIVVLADGYDHIFLKTSPREKSTSEQLILCNYQKWKIRIFKLLLCANHLEGR